MQKRHAISYGTVGWTIMPWPHRRASRHNKDRSALRSRHGKITYYGQARVRTKVFGGRPAIPLPDGPELIAVQCLGMLVFVRVVTGHPWQSMTVVIGWRCWKKSGRYVHARWVSSRVAQGFVCIRAPAGVPGLTIEALQTTSGVTSSCEPE